MSKKGLLSNYFHMGLQAIFFFLTCNYLRTILHEIGHGLGAAAAGLNFIGFYSAVFGTSYSIVEGPGQTWQYIIGGYSGPAMDLFLGLIIFFIILPRVKRWGSKLFWLFLAISMLLAFWGYMAVGGIFHSGDFANTAHLLKIPNLFIVLLGLIGLVGFAFLLTRRIFNVLSPYFPLGSFSKRIGILFLFWALPCTIYIGANTLISHNFSLSRFLIEFSIIVSVVIAVTLLSLLMKISSKTVQILPKWTTLTGAAGFVFITIIWLSLFGLRYQQAKGVIWGTPQESAGGVCNIYIHIDEDNSVRVNFCIRPSDSLRWKKLKKMTADWTTYNTFIERNLPVLLGVNDYSIINKKTDTVTPIYMGSGFQAVGCRKITILTDITNIAQKIDEDTFALDIIDFWRQKKRGYVDRLEIMLSGGMKFADYGINPEHASKANYFDEKRIFWENDNSRTSPEKIRVTISQY